MSQNHNHGPPGQPPYSETLATEQVYVDRKKYFLDLKENSRGRFLKITEDLHGRRGTILVPMDAAQSIMEALGRMITKDENLSRRN